MAIIGDSAKYLMENNGSELKVMGITNLAVRVRLMTGLKELCPPPLSPPSPVSSPTSLYRVSSGEIIENILSKATVNFNNEITINNIDSFEPDFDAVIMTSSLDLFLDHNEKLEWRGIESKAEFYTTSNNEDKFTEAYQINHPSLNDKFTRTIETKHASGQLIDGTVVCKEYPVSGLRHYPVLNKEDTNTKLNNKLKEIINKNVSLPVFFCGRLANYQYINQDEAIVQGFTAAENLKSYFK